MGSVVGPNNNINSNYNISNLVYSGLTFYYDAGRYYSYPNAGSTWTDLSPSNKTVTFYNQGGSPYTGKPPGSPTYSKTNYGEFLFDGINDFGIYNSFSLTSQVTLSAWVKCSFTGEAGILSHCNGGPVNLAYTITSGKMGYWYYDGTWRQVYGTNSVNTNEWKYLVWAKTGTNMKTYINNTLDANLTLNTDMTGTVRSIGSKWGPCYSDSGSGDSYSEMFSGYMAILMLHSRALSTDEIGQNWTNLRSRFKI